MARSCLKEPICTSSLCSATGNRRTRPSSRSFQDFCRFFRNRWKDGRARRKGPNRRNRVATGFANFSQLNCTRRIVYRICRSPLFSDSFFLFFFCPFLIFVVIFITVVSPLFSVPQRQRSPVKSTWSRDRTICISAHARFILLCDIR